MIAAVAPVMINPAAGLTQSMRSSLTIARTVAMMVTMANAAIMTYDDDEFMPRNIAGWSVTQQSVAKKGRSRPGIKIERLRIFPVKTYPARPKLA